MREVDAWVEKGEEEGGDEDERAVEDEEAGLVLHDSVAPTTGHFSDTVGFVSYEFLDLYMKRGRDKGNVPVDASD